jgi:hypothetical protein
MNDKDEVLGTESGIPSEVLGGQEPEGKEQGDGMKIEVVEEKKKRGRKPGQKAGMKVGADGKTFHDEKKEGAKRGRKPKEKKEKAEKDSLEAIVKKMISKAGLQELPPLRTILAGKVGTNVRICDIGIFIGEKENLPKALQQIAEKCTLKNRINLSAEIDLNNVFKVSQDILIPGQMFQPITVARVEDGAIECTSGRHRLAFLAMAYGPEAEVPVYIEDMDLNTARDAVVYSNQARKIAAQERAEHAVMAALGGNVEADQEELYQKLIKTRKNGISNYCVYSVIDRHNPAKFDFPVSSAKTRRGGELTTLANIQKYWKAALFWQDGMDRRDFDASLKDSVEFLNALVKELQAVQGFKPEVQLSEKSMIAAGKYYNSFIGFSTSSPLTIVKKLAGVMVNVIQDGHGRSGTIFQDVTKGMKQP